MMTQFERMHKIDAATRDAALAAAGWTLEELAEVHARDDSVAHNNLASSPLGCNRRRGWTLEELLAEVHARDDGSVAHQECRSEPLRCNNCHHRATRSPRDTLEMTCRIRIWSLHH